MAPDDDAERLARLAQQVESTSQARAADPSTFLVEVLRHYWLDETDEEADALWRVTVRDQPAYAIDVLNCLGTIAEHPPEDLVRLVVERSGVIHYTEGGPGRPQPYDREGYAAWLGTVYDRWLTIFLDARPS